MSCIDVTEFSRQKHWTAKRSFLLHALNLKRCGVYGGRDRRVWEMGAEKCGEGVGKCVGGWDVWKNLG